MHRIKPTPYLLLFFLFCLCSNFTYGQIQQIRQELNGLPFIKDSVTMVNSLNRLGTLYRTRNADSCFYYGMKAKHLATNIHYKKGQTEADHVIAYALFKRGLYAESLELFSKVLSAYQQFDDTEKIVRVYLDMIEVLNKDVADRTEITSLLHKVIQIGSTLEKDSIMSDVYMVYINRNSYLPDDSIPYYLDKSTEIATRYNNERMLHYNQMSRVNVLISNNRLEEAFPLIKQLLTDARRNGSVNQEINALFLMIGYYEDNNPRLALDYYYQAYEVAQKSGDSYLEIYILTNALEAANQLGDKDKIIKVHVELEKAWAADWENTKKFISDYVQFNAIQHDNKLLSEKNAQRAVWLLIVSLSAVIIVLAIYLIMSLRSRKAKAQIEALNNAANMQIFAMEEVKHQAVRDEQQRLGQDLHDGLSSSIASIKHQLEILSMDTDDGSLKNKLGVLQIEIANAYESARNKSHEWFNGAEEQQEQSFERAIKLLADSALPDSRYNKDIQIDNGSLMRVNMDTRISLLRIIQEAITNIIKHAKAKSVDILIYEETDSLILTISDDGKGLGEKNSSNEKSTMGLQSIRRRVQYLDGEMKIHSDMTGTEIIVCIPLTPL